MDVGYRSPLFDLFLRGGVDRDVRMLAARGALAPAPLEQLALLALLVDDADAEIRAVAAATIARLPAAALSGYLSRPEVTPALRQFYAQPVVPVDSGPPAPPAAPEEEVTLAESPDAGQPGPVQAPSNEPPAENAPGDTLGAAQRLARMTVADRIKVAMQGSREERAILVRDSNKLVSMAVLASPKLSESEVDAIARMTNVAEDVLRAIGTSRHWLKTYGVVAGLTHNPKTPIAVSLSLLNRLAERDLKMLSMDRNVPEALRLGARKMLTNAEARKR